MAEYKYLGLLLDDHLTFKAHIQNLAQKLRLKLGFYFRNRACFSFATRKKLVESTFLPLLDYGDFLYMHAPNKYLHQLDSAYHGALRFITGCKPFTHSCTLYNLVQWPSLAQRRLTRWRLFIYKSIIGTLPPYLCRLMSFKVSTRSLRSNDNFNLVVPRARTELGKQAFRISAPSAWNLLQNDLKLDNLVSFGQFKRLLKHREAGTMGTCPCLPH